MDISRQLRGIQFVLQAKFGKTVTSDSGENTLVIAPDRILLTDSNCKIIARGPAKVATVLVRKRRKNQ